MPANFLEVDCREVGRSCSDLVEPGSEAQIAHSATVIAARSKRDGAALNAVGNLRCPAGNCTEVDRHDRGRTINRSFLLAAGCFGGRGHNEGSQNVGLWLWSRSN